MTSRPDSPRLTVLPSSSTTSMEIPGTGFWADPGLVAVTPGSGLIMWAPVSVCHQVSTMGAGSCLAGLPGPLFEPMTSRYHRQASGLMGSPTVPSTRRLERSYWSGNSRPHFMQVRSEEHTSELQSRGHLVCRLLLEKKKLF